MQQHFIPQFYLRAWTDPETPSGQEPWVWVSDLASKKVTRRSPKNVAAMPGYYSVAGDDWPESLLSGLESTAAPIIKRLRDGGSSWTDQERADVLCFAAFLAVRVPEFRNMIEAAIGEMARTMGTMTASEPAYFAQTVDKAIPNHGMSASQVEELRRSILEPDNFAYRGHPTLSLAVFLQAARETVYPLFAKMSWRFLRASEGPSFVTSDRPVTWFDPTPRPAFFAAGHGLCMPGIQVTFPLGPRMCLFGGWGGKTGSIEAGSRCVRAVNRHRFRGADRFVFADSEAAASEAIGSGSGVDEK